jgi:hypothetical protein
MAGLVPAIHVFSLLQENSWMPGTRPGMTVEVREVEPLIIHPYLHHLCVAVKKASDLK